MKLYTVTLEVAVMVVAESEADAQRIGFRAMRDELSNYSREDCDAEIATSYPGSWDADCLVYQDRRNSPQQMTAGGAMKLNADPARR